MDVDLTEKDCGASFMHPPGTRKHSEWPVKEDICWVSVTDILRKIM